MSRDHRHQSFEEGIRRMGDAVGKALTSGAADLERWASGCEHVSRRERDRMERERRKKEKKLEELRGRSPQTGGVMLVAAAVLVVMAFITPLWWLVFVALGLGIGGVSQFGAGKEIARLERELGLAPDPEEEEARRAQSDPSYARLRRVDELAALLSKELTEGPEALRLLVARPKETVESIRKGCHALAEREKSLRALAKDGLERLARDREQLGARRDAEKDPETKERLTAALAAMDAQTRQQAELESRANRLEAEQVRLAWSLEGLYTQVVKARTSLGEGGAAPVEEARLRTELERLTTEVSAVAQALEEVSGISGVDSGPALGQKRERTR